MKARQIIEKALKEGRASLNEAESKLILSQYGIPVVEEALADTPQGAAAAADDLGYPVALKGLARGADHKSELGLVRVGLSSAGQVEAQAEKMTEIQALESELSFCVQKMVAAKRELVAGLFTDEQFGPVVMFGVGGVLTEALDDVAFGLAPLSSEDAADMIREIRSQKLLGAFRGMGPADKSRLVRVLTGLSRLALDFPEISEVDINPLMVDDEGALVAVDALIVLSGEPPKDVKKTAAAGVPPEIMGKMFLPRSVAVIGASAEIGKWGHMVATNIIAGGYEGKIYLVNPKGGTILERPACKSVEELPEPVDLAVVTIPAAGVAGLLPGLAKKGIHNMLLITSGFGETGPEGKQLEQDLVAQARKHGVYILGPNTMGITNPHIKLYCMGSHLRTGPGTTALVAQSGNMGAQLMEFAEKQGIGIRAFCGSGNEAMITIEDFMEGFDLDPVTKTVVLYIESVKDGRRFFESAKKVGQRMPVVVLKGGRTQAGSRAAASHTGAMASNHRVFDAACRQAGAVRVDRPMDLLDLSAAFSSLPRPKGNRVAIMTLGGGWGVVCADLCAEHGLEVVDLSPEIFAKIDKLLPPYWSRGNPIDLVGERDRTLPFSVMEALMEWDGCDAVFNMGIMGRRHALGRMIQSTMDSDPHANQEELSAIHQVVADIEKQFAQHLADLMEKHQKPILGVPLVTQEEDRTVMQFDSSPYGAVFFQTPERAVKALARMVERQARVRD